jgi:hypothetical protein
MRVYDVKVRLASQGNGNIILTEVARKDVSAPEVLILRRKHGDDKVLVRREGKMDKRPHAAERDRLTEKYGKAMVEAMFGPSHNKLPVELELLPASDDPTDEDDGAPIMPAHSARVAIDDVGLTA